MRNDSLPTDDQFWIHGHGETLYPRSAEELLAQLRRGEVPPDLPVYSHCRGQWLPLSLALSDVPTFSASAEQPTSVKHGAMTNVDQPPLSGPPSPPESGILPGRVPWLRRSSVVSGLIGLAIAVYLIGAITAGNGRAENPLLTTFSRVVPALLILLACGACLTGPIYFAARAGDRHRRKWPMVNKIAAVVLGVLAISCAGQSLIDWRHGQVPLDSPPNRTPMKRATIAGADKMIRTQFEQRTGRPLDSLTLHETSDGNFAGELTVGRAVYDVRVQVNGLEMIWDATLRQSTPSKPAKEHPGP